MVFVSHRDAPEVVHPGKESLDLPSSSVAPQWSSVLSPCDDPVVSVWRDELDSLLSHSSIEPVAVIRKIPNKSLRPGASVALGESVLDKGDFMWLSRRRVDGDRKTSAVCHCHELRTLAPLGVSNAGAPFFATTKVASTKHSDILNLPRLSRS